MEGEFAETSDQAFPGQNPTMPPTNPTDPALALVHQGWDHLKHQRPLAAWASWRRALRIEPEQEAATHALHVLANAGDLPEAARAEYRFLTPSDDAQRARWDGRFRGRDLEELADAADAFGALAVEDPSDAHARFNQGLCLAWLGRNAEAVAALDQAVRAIAGAEPEVADSAWTIAEILRQGGGAEHLADDLNHVVSLAWTPGDDPSGFLDERDDVRPIENPVDPVNGQPRLPGARLYEWLDRPWPAATTSALAMADDLRRVRATIVRRPGSLRLSGTDPVLLDGAFAEAARSVGDRLASIRREATPMPLAFLDAAVWAIRIPPGLDEEERARLDRSAVERYYETIWLHRPRRGLDGRSPVEAGRLAQDGDSVARVKLSAVVRVREQLGMRPTTALLYQGYPFDRLRRRLGLAPADPEAIDPLDATSMSGPELDRLDPAGLDDYALADAYESAAALGDDRRTARFAEVLATRDPSSLARLDVRALFATLVRREVAENSRPGAFRHLDRAQAVDLALTGGVDGRTYQIWRAEVFVRTGFPQDAVRIYEGLIDNPPDPALALDATEMLLDSDFVEEGRLMARHALDLARAAANPELAERARAYLDRER
jgi:tetratricopeptide (TPR) repeat protein